jgi:hypothetical protein
MTDSTSHVTRRSILLGAAVTLICGPAILRASGLMQVRVLPLEVLTPQLRAPKTLGEWYQLCFYHNLNNALNTGHAMTYGGVSGQPISVVENRRIVADARAHGWLAA